MPKGIIVTRDIQLVEAIEKFYPGWLVLATPSEQEEMIKFYPTPLLN